MSDHRFLQTGFDKQLSHLIEELGEVVTAAGLHLNGDHPSIENLNAEISDVIQAWNRLTRTAVSDGIIFRTHASKKEGPAAVKNGIANLLVAIGAAIAAAGKTQRWGVYSVNPLLPLAEQETNWAWLNREMENVLHAWLNAKDALGLERREDHAIT